MSPGSHTIFLLACGLHYTGFRSLLPIKGIVYRHLHHWEPCDCADLFLLSPSCGLRVFGFSAGAHYGVTVPVCGIMASHKEFTDMKEVLCNLPIPARPHYCLILVRIASLVHVAYVPPSLGLSMFSFGAVQLSALVGREPLVVCVSDAHVPCLQLSVFVSYGSLHYGGSPLLC